MRVTFYFSENPPIFFSFNKSSEILCNFLIRKHFFKTTFSKTIWNEKSKLFFYSQSESGAIGTHNDWQSSLNRKISKQEACTRHNPLPSGISMRSNSIYRLRCPPTSPHYYLQPPQLCAKKKKIHQPSHRALTKRTALTGLFITLYAYVICLLPREFLL